MDDALEKSAVRKVYMRLLPFAILTYFLCYVDRINVSFAALTMRGDLDMSATAFGFAFTLPSGFQTASYTAGALAPASRPGPTAFPTASANSLGPDWLTQFMNTAIAPDNASGSQCYYPTLPGSIGCPSKL